MLKEKNRLDFLLSILLFVPTLVNISNVYYFIFLCLGILELFRKSTFLHFNRNVILIIAVFISILIFYSGFFLNEELIDNVQSITDFLPLSLTILACIFLVRSKYINDQVLLLISFYIIIEIIVGIIEYVLNIHYFIKPSNDVERMFIENDLIYYSRVYGLSSNSSVLALKSFTLLLLSQWLNLSKKKRAIFILAACIGIFITFNRTALAAGLFFAALLLLKNLRDKKIIGMAIITIAVVLFYFFENLELIINQLNRGKDNLDISGRDVILKEYLGFILANPFLGNSFHTLRLTYHDYLSHSHNSFIQLLAETGFLFFLLVQFYILKNLNKNNFVFVLPIMLYSVAQYGIFWGISFLDIIFFYFLISKRQLYDKRIQEI